MKFHKMQCKDDCVAVVHSAAGSWKASYSFRICPSKSCRGDHVRRVCTLAPTAVVRKKCQPFDEYVEQGRLTIREHQPKICCSSQKHASTDSCSPRLGESNRCNHFPKANAHTKNLCKYSSRTLASRNTYILHKSNLFDNTLQTKNQQHTARSTRELLRGYRPAPLLDPARCSPE